MPPTSVAFVPSDQFGKPRESDRKLIRSHCRKGKNLRIGVRPVEASHDLQQTIRLGHQGDRNISMPPPPPSDLSLVTFSSHVDHPSQMLIYDAFIRARRSLYPCMLNVDFNIDDTVSFRWLLQDAAYLHCFLFCSLAIDDVSGRKPLTHTGRYHLGETIALLQNRLTDKAGSILDSTISIVISLGIVASILGDNGSAQAHLMGLQQMIRLRGGLRVFRHNPKLYDKLSRIDLVYALHTGHPPLFFAQEQSLLSAPEASTGTNTADQASLRVSSSPYRVAAPVFKETLGDLQQLSWSLNTHIGSSQKLRYEEFEESSCSIQYRLLMLQGTLTDILDECIRLGSLAFLISTFQLPRGEDQYQYLSNRFRECCCALEPSSQETRDWPLWLLLIGAISLYGVDASWLRKRWRNSVPANMTWSEARRRLKGMVWIDSIHDELGEYAFRVLNEGDVADSEKDHTRLLANGWAICPFQI